MQSVVCRVQRKGRSRGRKRGIKMEFTWKTYILKVVTLLLAISVAVPAMAKKDEDKNTSTVIGRFLGQQP